ncbi:MAG: peptidoglycan DD-metalloendopeptidase family protein [Candidatus Gastranaerophilales bacterium]|nr:peptidoglycan DD-metalloendopeptidase family protein [Candidatus Gastranaerophilales bacterium]
MAFKKARSCNFQKEKMIIDETTEEILDYLLRSRNFLSDLTLLKLNQKVKISFSKKIYELVEGFCKSSKVTNSKSSLIIFFTALLLAGNCFNSFSTVFAVSNELKQQIININQGGGRLIPISLNESSINKDNIIPVSEEYKDSLSGIKPGQPLMIIPKNSKVHVVTKGENLVNISNKYNVSLKKLISVNSKIDLVNLTAGEKIIIPDIKLTRNQRYRLASRGFSPSIGLSQDRCFRWPTEGKREIISKFGFREFRQHSGIDIYGKNGDPIVAAKSGTVVFSGWNGNYGRCIIIDHGYGIQTLYAHSSKLLVNIGDSVYTGQEIAKIGATGRATCSHLHFQIMLNGVPKNPARYLRS